MKKLLLLILISLGTSTIYSQGKGKEKETPKDYSENVLTINSTINTLYATISGEKGKKRDWALFKYLFHPDGKLITSGKNDESKFQIRYMKPDDYIKSSGKWIVDNGFIEKEVHRTVDAFGNIAHVFSTFESFHSKTDEEPFMRGINSIQLLNDGTRWWIVNVFWDNENRRNPIPRNYLPK
ncbi:hypothetical protein ACGK9U_14165 [Mariniflexile sp. HNIBRBA6329]|uniref:hypothetical protein n=1 Tax=Mariniflexile sp. HNIBRBA6329 TaxID=3373088 RepID=UPI003744B3FA